MDGPIMTVLSELPTDLLRLVEPNTVGRYATERGWRRIDSSWSMVVVYGHPRLELVQLTVPLNTNAPDYAVRIAQVIGRLSDDEERSAARILNALLVPLGVF